MPKTTKPRNILIDSVAVRRRIDGFRVELNQYERRRAIRILHRRGLLDTEIAETLGYERPAIAAVRRRMGLPSNFPAHQTSVPA